MTLMTESNAPVLALNLLAVTECCNDSLFSTGYVNSACWSECGTTLLFTTSQESQVRRF